MNRVAVVLASRARTHLSKRVPSFQSPLAIVAGRFSVAYCAADVYAPKRWVKLVHTNGRASAELRLGDTVPNFQQQSQLGEIDLYNYLGNSWGVLFSHPRDFTPVCTTELGRVAKLEKEFAKRNVKVLALSVDDVASHKGWLNDINETQGVSVNYPILADGNRKVANLYGMIHEKSDNVFTVRSVFVIDPEKKLRLTITYPASTGRNFDEILRVIDSLQLTDNYKVATPVDWKHGDDVVIVPSVSDADAKKLFPKGWKTVRPYLRMTAQPNK